jgi:hypothetical protein
VTCEESGNIARLVKTEKCGMVFKDENALMDAFRDGTIYNVARERRKQARKYKSLKFGKLSMGLLDLGARQ